MTMRLESTLLLVLLGCFGCGERRNDQASATPAPAAAQVVPITNMIAVKPGTFQRREKEVSVPRDFWLGKFEVTQGEFSALMGRNPSHFTGDASRPVEKVSFVDAATYCAVLTQRERSAGRLPPGYEYRLPTEAEWELACRAGSTNRFSFGDSIELADAYAWTAENSNGMTHPVGGKQPNAWGFHDMHGNVWEWCLDWFDPAEAPDQAAAMPKSVAPRTFKIFKGGGWNQEAEFAGSANRFMMSPKSGIYFLGFRVALGAPIADESPR